VQTEFLGVAALGVDGAVGQSYGSPDVGSQQFAVSPLGVGVSLVCLVRRVPVALGESTIDAASVYTARVHRSMLQTERNSYKCGQNSPHYINYDIAVFPPLKTSGRDPTFETSWDSFKTPYV